MLILGKLRWFALATFFAISPIFAFAPQTSAYTYDVKNIDQVVRGYLYASMLLDCATNEGVDNVSSGDARNFSIFSEGKKPSGVYLKYNTNDSSVSEGEVSCSDGAYTKAALNFFGWSDAYTFMCDLGATRVNPKVSCLDTANDSGYNTTSIFGQLKNKLKARSNGIDIFNLPNPARYILYRESYILGCHATKDRDYTDSATDKHDATQDNWGLIRYINADGTVNKPVLYKTERGLAQQTSVSANGGVDSDGYDGRANCSALITLTNKYATDYLRFVMNKPDSSQSYPGTGTAARKGEDSSKLATGDSPGASAKPTCAIDAIGWIVCPVFNFMAKVTDASYGIVETMLLVRMPGATTNEGKSLYASWGAVRNLANISFIIAFLIIIYSQITGMGINNYGIKRMLPRLIVAAILVNISYWVCAAAVEATNIVGASIKGLIDNAGNAALPTGVFEDSQTGNGWTGIAGTALVATGAVFVTFAVALPLLLSTFLVILGVVIALTLRQALIYLLIVISPLAFVAYLLPNTEGLFKKWFGLFKTLLLMFPIVAFVFAGSALASKILTGVAQGSPLLAAMAAGVAILPLIVVPTLIKTSSSVIGKFMNNNPTKGLIDRSKRGLEKRGKRWDDQRATAGLKTGGIKGAIIGGRARSRARNRAIDKAAEGNLGSAEASYIADLARNDDPTLLNRASRGRLGGTQGEKLISQLSRGAGEAGQTAALAGAINVQAKMEAEEVNAAKAVINSVNLDSEALKSLAKGNDVSGLKGTDSATRRAAIQMALQKSTVSDAEDIIKSIGKEGEAGAMSKAQRQDVADGLVSSGLVNKATHLGGKTLDDIAQGKVTSEDDLDNAMAYHVNKGKYNAETIVAQDGQSMERLVKVTNKGNSPNGTVIDQDQKEQMDKQAKKVLSDDRLNVRINSADSKNQIEIMASR